MPNLLKSGWLLSQNIGCTFSTNRRKTKRNRFHSYSILETVASSDYGMRKVIWDNCKHKSWKLHWGEFLDSVIAFIRLTVLIYILIQMIFEYESWINNGSRASFNQYILEIRFASWRYTWITSSNCLVSEQIRCSFLLRH